MDSTKSVRRVHRNAVRFISQSVAVRNLAGLRVAHARFAVHAADAFARTAARLAVAVCSGKSEALQGLAALASAFGDGIPVHLVCLLDRADVPSVRDAAAALAGSVVDGRSVHAGVLGSPVRVSLAVTENELRRFAGESLQDESFAAERRTVRLRSRDRVVFVCGRRALMHLDPLDLRRRAETLPALVLLSAAATAGPPECIERYRSAFHGSGLLLPAGGFFWTLALYEADVVLLPGGDKLTEAEGYDLHDFSLVPGRVLPVDLAHLADSGVSSRRRKFVYGMMRRQAKMIAGIAGEARRARKLRPLDPLYLAHAIFARAPAETVFVAEGNGTGMFQWSVNQGFRPVVYPARMATIGVLLPYACGARTATRRPVWCFAGDGSLRYEPELLGELVRLRAGCVIFVFRNAAWDSIRLEQTFVLRGRYPGTDLPEQDFAGLARDYGCAAMRVEDDVQLEAALERAANHREERPLVIDIGVRKDQVPPAGLTWALAELDYILAAVPKRHILLSFVCAMLRRIPWRILRLLWRSI